jgi:hypothetical protein
MHSFTMSLWNRPRTWRPDWTSPTLLHRPAEFKLSNIGLTCQGLREGGRIDILRIVPQYRASMRRALVLFVVLCLPLSVRGQDSLDKLATDFWAWRAQWQPFNADDIPRIERPAGLKPSWSAESIAHQRNDLSAFEARWKKLDASKWRVPQQVDYRLMGSALARVHWELDMNRRWQDDATFYVDQAMTPVVEAILPPPPFDKARTADLIARVQNIPSIVEDAEANLQHPCAPFAKLAIASLSDIRSQLWLVAHDVGPLLVGDNAQELAPAVERAASSLESFRDRLQQRLPTMPPHTPVGRDAYVFFLKNVALYPFTPEQLLDMSRQEWARSVAAEQIEHQRNIEVRPLEVFDTLDEQIERTNGMESAVRRFLARQEILTVPQDFPHYTVRAVPPYLVGLGDFSELDDFTGPSRMTQEGTRWTPKPSPNPGYFEGASQRDPRPLIVHEGVPGHYMQLWLSWRNPDPIRRHYYDSGANEGLGFYAEEMMLLAGLFEDSPHTREIIYNFARLRALRVEVDVKLALGQLNNEEASAYLAKTVPMNPKTAQSEGAAFATQPGQAISYQAGKIQITKFLADARFRAGEKFDIRAFNDFVWRNGNLPIELQRAEWFGESPLVKPTTSSDAEAKRKRAQ